MRMAAQSASMHKHTVGPSSAGWVTVTATAQKALDDRTPIRLNRPCGGPLACLHRA
jgi:hypothetical protein